MEMDKDKELIKYWTFQRYLVEYCLKHCIKVNLCWNEDSGTYYPETMLEICPWENIKKAVRILSKMDPLKYVVGVEEYSKIMEIVEKKLKEKVIRV